MADLEQAMVRAQGAPPDLIIYIGPGRKLGAANLWSGAYAEFSFFEREFADFGMKDLAAALAGFGKRERRFGGVA